MNILKEKRILAIAGIIFLILGTVLPFIKISFFGIGQTIALTGYWEGYVIMVLAISHVVTIFDDYIEKFVPRIYEKGFGKKIKGNKKWSLLPTILVILLLVITMINIGFASYMTYQIGFYLIIIGTVCLILHPFIYKG